MSTQPTDPIRYDSSHSEQESLFEQWEKGCDANFPRPLSVRSKSYRQLLSQIIKKFLNSESNTILSIGSGNGFMERDLALDGFSVLASDKSDQALFFCKEKKLETLRLDILTDNVIDIGEFDLVLCDGVLGHCWKPASGLLATWEKLALLTKPGKFLVISNDLADDDRINTEVFGHPGKFFFRPPVGWFSNDAAKTGKWHLGETQIILYERRFNEAMRMREVLVFSKSIDEQTEKIK